MAPWPSTTVRRSHNPTERTEVALLQFSAAVVAVADVVAAAVDDQTRPETLKFHVEIRVFYTPNLKLLVLCCGSGSSP